MVRAASARRPAQASLRPSGFSAAVLFLRRDTMAPERIRSAARILRWIGRAAVWALLVTLVAEIALEATSRISYHKSLAALQERLWSAEQNRENLSFVEATKAVAGWPSTREKSVGPDAQIEYHWPSFL